MKIVLIADCLTTQRAGIHMYAKQFISGMTAQYPSHKYYHITTQKYPLESSTNIIIPIKKWLPFHYRFRYFFEIPKAIKKIGADIAIEMAHFGPFRLPRSIYSICVVHDLTPINYPAYHDRLSVWWHSYCFAPLLRRVDAIITNSHTTQNDLVTQLDIDVNKIWVNYPNPQRYLPEISTIDKTQSSNKPSIQLLTVGTLEPRKRHSLILQAIENACDTLPSMTIDWHIVGAKGWKNDEFNTLLRRSPVRDQITIHGYLSDDALVDIYQSSDYFVYASSDEGFGLPLIEALWYGCPLIVSNISAHREVAADAAQYFDTVEELTQILISLPDWQGSNSKQKSAQRREYWKNQTLHLPILSNASKLSST